MTLLKNFLAPPFIIFMLVWRKDNSHYFMMSNLSQDSTVSPPLVLAFDQAFLTKIDRVYMGPSFFFFFLFLQVWDSKLNSN